MIQPQSAVHQYTSDGLASMTYLHSRATPFTVTFSKPSTCCTYSTCQPRTTITGPTGTSQQISKQN